MKYDNLTQEGRLKGNKNRWKHYDTIPEGFRLCLRCKEIKAFKDFHKHAKCRGGFNSVCKECRLPFSQANYSRTSLEYRMFMAAKNRAKLKKVPFTLLISDISIPDVCPVFNVPMKHGTIYAPSLDRRLPSLGYTKDNIQVMSHRANVLKNNATIEELEQLVKFLKLDIQ